MDDIIEIIIGVLIVFGSLIFKGFKALTGDESQPGGSSSPGTNLKEWLETLEKKQDPKPKEKKKKLKKAKETRRRTVSDAPLTQMQTKVATQASANRVATATSTLEETSRAKELLSKKKLRQAILMKEILDKPLALRDS